jgi:hypothetical protein
MKWLYILILMILFIGGKNMSIYGFKDNKCKKNIDAIVNNSSYSEEEQVIGTWIDDKPVYRKVFNFTSPKGGEDDQGRCWQGFATLSEHNIDKVINMDGFYYIGNTTLNWRKVGGSTFLNTDISVGELSRFMVGDGTLAFQRTAYEEDLNVFAIVEYTKTTD